MKIEDKIEKYLNENFEIYGFSGVGNNQVPEPEFDENSVDSDLFDIMSDLIYSLSDEQLSDEQIELKNEILDKIGSDNKVT